MKLGDFYRHSRKIRFSVGWARFCAHADGIMPRLAKRGHDETVPTLQNYPAFPIASNIVRTSPA